MAAKLYGSVNGESKEIKKLYAPSEKLDATTVTYDDPTPDGTMESIDVSTFLSTFLTRYPSYKWRTYGELQSFTFTRQSGSPLFIVTIVTSIETLQFTENSSSLASTWGVTRVNGYAHTYAYFSPSYTLVTRPIGKLYGSVNGQTKRIF